MTTILRLMGETDQSLALEQAVAAVRGGAVDARVFSVDPASFRLVPGAPFAYWVADEVLDSFRRYPLFETENRFGRQGGVTGDDFRWLRIWIEGGNNLPGMAKGGSFSRFYQDVYLAVRWDYQRNTFSAFTGLLHRPSLQPASFPFYFRPGLTWPLRTNGLSFRVLPARCVFSHKGPSAFVDKDDPLSLLSLCAVLNSAAFGMLVSIQLARTELAQSYEVGLIQQTPVPNLTLEQQTIIAALTRRAWSIQRELDTITESSHAFQLPALIQSLRWTFDSTSLRTELTQIQTEIDTRCFDLYGFSEADRLAARAASSGPTSTDVTDTDQDDEDDKELPADVTTNPADQWAAVVSWAMGVAWGRFDVRLGLPGSTRPAEPEPFDPLPACSPGMLAGPDGQPARTPPAGYPIDWPTDGILVDDPGHDRDLITRIRQVFTVVFGDEAEARWLEASVALDPTGHDLRTWLRRQAFERHLKTHSKSRRKAPLYWPLSIPSGQYTVWIYAHRVTADTLFAITSDWVKPKAEAEALKLARMVADAGPNPSGAQRQELEAQETLATELRTLQTDLTQLTPLLQPFFDDGIVVWSSPLWPLITTHAGWQKELRTSWAALADGEYDWAQLAMRLWPERVIPKCADDRSLAIAHDLESVFWHQDDDEKWVKTPVSAAEIQRLIRERQVPAIITARDWLLARPTDRPAARRRSAAPAAPTRRTSTRAEASARTEAPAPVEAPPRSVAPVPTIDAKLLDRLVETIASYPDGVGKAEILAAAAIPPSVWNAAIAALLDSGRVTRSGEKRGTTYQAAAKT